MQGTEVLFNGTKTSVNTYFWKAFQLLEVKINELLKDPRRKYIITGHSLGGAMASLLAIHAVDNGVS